MAPTAAETVVVSWWQYRCRRIQSRLLVFLARLVGFAETKNQA
jgi:hypothetical protein